MINRKKLKRERERENIGKERPKGKMEREGGGKKNMTRRAGRRAERQQLDGEDA